MNSRWKTNVPENPSTDDHAAGGSLAHLWPEGPTRFFGGEGVPVCERDDLAQRLDRSPWRSEGADASDRVDGHMLIARQERGDRPVGKRA
jgi:hypothetical protein